MRRGSFNTSAPDSDVFASCNFFFSFLSDAMIKHLWQQYQGELTRACTLDESQFLIKAHKVRKLAADCLDDVVQERDLPVGCFCVCKLCRRQNWRTQKKKKIVQKQLTMTVSARIAVQVEASLLYVSLFLSNASKWLFAYLTVPSKACICCSGSILGSVRCAIA